MRPPSYYTSIAQGNERNSRAGHLMGGLSNQQLRSSFSSSPSSSYVQRSHLPYTAQSTLVAHCITGAGSSTRPYSSSSSSSLSSASSQQYYSRAKTSSSSSSNAYLSSQPVAKRLGSSTLTPSYSGYSYSGTSNSYLPSRSSRLSSNVSSSSSPSSSVTSRYRPTSSSSSHHLSSSYYKPIRLSERPLLSQISNRINNTSDRIDKSKGELSTSNKYRSDSSSHQPAERSKEHSDLQPSRAVIKSEAKHDQENDWSADVARNISRNKYLIKFREIEKPVREVAEPDSQAERGVDQRELANETREDNMKLEREHTQQRQLKQATSEKLSGSIKQQNEGEPSEISELACEPADCDSPSAKRRVKKAKKKSSEPGEPLAPADVPGADPSCCVEAASNTPKPRRNVKLRLRPIGSKPKQANVSRQPLVECVIGNQEQPSVSADQELAPAAASVTKTKRLVKKSSDPKLKSEQDKRAKQTVQVPSKDERPQELEQGNTRKPSQDLKLDTELAAQLAKGSAASRQANSGSTPTSGSSGAPKANRIKFRDYHIEDFNFLSVLGHGGWGFVILAELRDYDACFAVKCIKKITIVEDDDYESIMIERKVLALGNINPFICKLFCTFETSGYLFFVMEYCAGGDLMFHVQREGKFSEPRSRFYAAEIICAIRFLHNRHIIYRDLKLDNILLDSRGHVRLVDFGMCQCRTYREEMLPSNFCGTPEYISPEIIKGVPYNHSVDWWSFGVLLYEMVVGKMPFRGNDENELLWNVCYEQIHYPMFLSKQLSDLLKLLLEREPTKRMGMSTCKAGDIYDQPFFREVDWKAVEELRVDPPFVPEVNSKRDVQNFDTDFTESACELSPVDDDTLAKIDQNQFQKFPYTNPDSFMFEQPAR